MTLGNVAVAVAVCVIGVGLFYSSGMLMQISVCMH